jgi:TPR repeat protein
VWFRKAVEQGHAMALINLGFLYKDREGMLRNDVLAYVCLNLA